MERFKNILDCLWLITKLIFIIIALFFGIKIILFMILPCSIYGSCDWSPFATILGAILTGGITWFAVDKTSKLDKKARLYELKYKNYLENLQDLKQYIRTIDRLIFYFDKNSYNSVNKNIEDSILNKDAEIMQLTKIYGYICKINPSFKAETKGFDETFKLFNNAYNFLKRQFYEHYLYLKSGDIKYKKDFISDLNEQQFKYNGEEFLAYYKEKMDVDYNVIDMINALDNLKNVIENAFVMDEK